MKKRFIPPILISLIIVVLVFGVVLDLDKLAGTVLGKNSEEQNLVILNPYSHPKTGESWAVSFKTTGTADLTITPSDQATINNLDFISLTCNGQKRIPKILENDIIFYHNWTCDGTGKVTHLVNVAVKHIIKFQFSDQIAYAYNSPAISWTSGLVFKDDFSGDLSNWLSNWGEPTDWTIENGILKATRPGGGWGAFSCLPADFSCADSVVCVRAKVNSFFTWCGLGIVQRGSDISNNYFDFNEWYHDRHFMYKDFGGVRSLLLGTNYPFELDTWYRFKFSAIGTSLKSWVEEGYLISATDSDMVSGHPGLHLTSASTQLTYFDDFSVSQHASVGSLANTLRVSGLSGSNFVELYDASDVVKGSATQSGGNADIDFGGLWFPFPGYIKIWEDNTKTTLIERSPATGNRDFYGGDVGAPPVPASLTSTAITVNVGQIIAINQLTFTDGTPTATVTAANDLRIRIPAGVNAEWDIANTSPTFGGTASGKVAAAVTYPTNKILLIDVTTDFAAGDTLTIAGLSYIGVTGPTAAAPLEFTAEGAGGTYTAGAASTNITVADGDQDTLTAVTATSSNYFAGLTANYTINFTVPATGVITKNGKIKVTFPAGFNVAGATAGAMTGIDGTVAASVAGQVVTLTRQNDGTNSLAGVKAVVINNIVNPSAGGYNHTLTVRTDTSADELLATANSAAFNLIAAGGWSGQVSDVIAPTSTITEPKEGMSIEAGKAYTIKGTAIDRGGSLVKEVEVSLDGGNTWQKAEIKEVIANVLSWEYVWQNPTSGNYIIKSRAADEIGNIEVAGPGIKVSVAAPTPVPVPEKPITEMTIEEIKAKILEIQQKIIDLLQQLIQLIQEQVAELQQM